MDMPESMLASHAQGCRGGKWPHDLNHLSLMKMIRFLELHCYHFAYQQPSLMGQTPSFVSQSNKVDHLSLGWERERV